MVRAAPCCYHKLLTPPPLLLLLLLLLLLPLVLLCQCRGLRLVAEARHGTRPCGRALRPRPWARQLQVAPDVGCGRKRAEARLARQQRHVRDDHGAATPQGRRAAIVHRTAGGNGAMRVAAVAVIGSMVAEVLADGASGIHRQQH